MHIIQIPSAAPSFMGIWAIQSPLKIHCYTCMSFKTCWSRLIYTKLSSHRSFVINMYVVTMAWRCISLWSFHRSLQRKMTTRGEISLRDIAHKITFFQSRTFGEIHINVFPVLLDNKNDRNCTEMNNLLVCSHSLPGKIEWIRVKTNDVTMHGTSANL